MDDTAFLNPVKGEFLSKLGLDKLENACRIQTIQAKVRRKSKMTDILQDLNLDFGWIWSSSPKSKQTSVQILEDALVRFLEKFGRSPDFALVHAECDIFHNLVDLQEQIEIGFPIFFSRYALKKCIMLGVSRDSTKTDY